MTSQKEVETSLNEFDEQNWEYYQIIQRCEETGKLPYSKLGLRLEAETSQNLMNK